jgi:hypothetical protein
MPNPISKSEAQFKLRNVTAKLSIAQSAAREGDWRLAFDNAYEAQDLLTILLPHLEEAANELSDKRDRMPPPPKEPVGSLKYGVPPGTPTERVGGLGYRGSHRDGEPSYGPPEPIHVAPTKRGADTRPPKPIIITPPPEVIIVPPPPTRGPLITPPPAPPEPPKPVIPDGAEVVTLNITRLMNGIANDEDREAMTLLYELPEEFRKTVLKTNALSRRPVTIYRVGDVWSIYK